jgi:GH24 family phage-related lysozyme (muramidase)
MDVETKESNLLFRVCLMGLLTVILVLTMSLICPKKSNLQATHIGEVLVTYEEPLSEGVKQLIELIQTQQEWDDSYNNVINSLKEHEGFRAEPYYCVANVLTVGYGHAIKEGERFSYPMSEETADSLLRADLDVAIEYVQETTNLEHLQLLAIGQFVFQLGSGNFNKSTLKQLIVEGEPIDDEIIKWIHIRTKKGMISHKQLMTRRTEELELYNSAT